MVPVIEWPEMLAYTILNRSTSDRLLVKCFVLNRLAIPCRLKDIESVFGLNSSHMSELFWEVLNNFVKERISFLMEDLLGYLR